MRSTLVFLAFLVFGFSAQASYMRSASGVYAPTLTAVDNISATGTGHCQYLRLGQIVTVSCRVPFTCTSASGTATAIGISLPIASNLTDTQDVNGTGALGGNSELGNLNADDANDRANYQLNCQTTNSLSGRRVIFQYEIK